jgi:hypothetical protein
MSSSSRGEKKSLTTKLGVNTYARCWVAANRLFIHGTVLILVREKDQAPRCNVRNGISHMWAESACV